MTQKIITVRIHPERKRRRRYRPEPFGILLGVLLSAVCLVMYAGITTTVLARNAQDDLTVPAKATMTQPLPHSGEEAEVGSESVPVDYNALVPAADPADMRRLAQMVWGEARGVGLKVEQEAVIWCVFNRIDDPRFPDTIAEVCTHSQFHGYDPDNPVEPEFYDMALRVWNEWNRLHLGDPTAVRTLPVEYVYFHGDGERNWFRTEYEEFENFWEPTHSHYGSDYM